MPADQQNQGPRPISGDQSRPADMQTGAVHDSTPSVAIDLNQITFAEAIEMVRGGGSGDAELRLRRESDWRDLMRDHISEIPDTARYPAAAARRIIRDSLTWDRDWTPEGIAEMEQRRAYWESDEGRAFLRSIRSAS